MPLTVNLYEIKLLGCIYISLELHIVILVMVQVGLIKVALDLHSELLETVRIWYGIYPKTNFREYDFVILKNGQLVGIA